MTRPRPRRRGIALVGAVSTLCLNLAAADGLAELQPADHAGWFPFVVPDLTGPDTEGSPIDLSFLSPEPAGSHGYLRARGEELVDDRGTPIRLFGSNICDVHGQGP